MILIFQAVLAADPSTYALSATVVLPPSGAVRIDVPADLIGGEPSDVATRMSLRDANGAEVPYAVLRSSESPDLEGEDLRVRPTDLAIWEVEAVDAPVDALVLDVQDLARRGPFDATVRWREGGAWVGGDSELVYRLDGAEDRTIEVPHVSGPFRISLSNRGSGERPRLVDVRGLRQAPEHVPAVVERIPVGEPLVTEEGRARYTLQLPGVRAVRAIRLSVPDTEDLFEREVTVAVPSDDGYGGGGSEYGQIRRIRVGYAHVDRVEIETNLVADTLVVEVDTDRGEPLAIDAIEVVSEGVYVVARDAGATPHILYAKGTVREQPHDLSVALSEILRPLPPLVAPVEEGPNPTFVPPPTAADVDGPGPDLTLARFAWERSIEGPAGWVRVSIGQDVVARARADLGDLRVVDAEGRQIPFLSWRTGKEEVREVVDFKREEVGNRTRLVIPLDSRAPVASVQLTTSKKVFSREVTFLRDAGRTTVALRRVTWNGPERGGTLVVDLGERVGEALLVEIDNGDDPPIAIDAVRVSTEVSELRARIPEGGARLVYGAPGVSAPDYDLYLLRQEVFELPVADAALGEERPLSPPVIGLVDRGAALAGVGLLAIGLLGVAIGVLRGVAAPLPAADGGPAEPPAPGDAPG